MTELGTEVHVSGHETRRLLCATDGHDRRGSCRDGGDLPSRDPGPGRSARVRPHLCASCLVAPRPGQPPLKLQHDLLRSSGRREARW